MRSGTRSRAARVMASATKGNATAATATRSKPISEKKNVRTQLRMRPTLR